MASVWDMAKSRRKKYYSIIDQALDPANVNDLNAGIPVILKNMIQAKEKRWLNIVVVNIRDKHVDFIGCDDYTLCSTLASTTIQVMYHRSLRGYYEVNDFNEGVCIQPL